LILPDNLHAHWAAVRRGLERVLEVGKGAVHWLPEDIYANLRLNRAQLFEGFDGDQYRGFFITETKREPYSNSTYLNVWVIYAPPEDGKDHFAGIAQFMPETIAFLDGLCQKVGAKWIELDGRRGWERFMKDYFEPVKVSFERKMP
jgi:hypothetical protein